MGSEALDPRSSDAKKRGKAAEVSPFRNLGLALRVLRELKDMSQADVADAAGMSKTQVSKYESGKELPKLESLERALRILKSSPLAFFYVIEMIDQVEAGELSPSILLESSFAPVITEAEQEAYKRLIKSTWGVVAEQVKTRVASATRRRRSKTGREKLE